MISSEIDDPKINKTSYIRIKFLNVLKQIKYKFPKYYEEFTGYNIENISTFDNFVKWMHTPIDAAALGIFRLLFGKYINKIIFT